MKRYTLTVLLAVLTLALVACDDGTTQANTGNAPDVAEVAETDAHCDFCVTPETAETAAATKPCDDCAEADPSTAEACDACATDTVAATTTQPSAMNASVTLAAPTTQPAEQTYKARSSPFLAPADRETPFDLDFAATDQDGNALKLADLVGKPIVMSFIFTRCGNPKMCPAITLQMANLQRSLDDANLADDVRVVLLSYDPVYDTPARLKKYGATRGFRFTHGDTILQPSVDDYRDLIGELAIAVAPLPDGSFNHAMELLVIDAQGRYVRDYQGDLWGNEPILEDVRKLVAEAK